MTLTFKNGKKAWRGTTKRVVLGGRRYGSGKCTSCNCQGFTWGGGAPGVCACGHSAGVHKY